MSGQIDVLIAEDSRIQAKILQKKLIEAGYAVRHGENGKIALDMVRQQRPTIIISDIEMPEMNGYEFCRAVKGDPQLRTIPLILLSTLSQPQDIIEGLHAGADNYVTKPYDAAYLLSRVRSLLDTPLTFEEDGDQETLEVTLAGKRYTVKSGRQQVLNLLISTFENAVEKNQELIRANEELVAARDQLQQWNTELEALNSQLDAANQRMSRDLDAAAKIQQSLLPSSVPDLARVKLAWKYIPCDELAGDFLNFFMLDDNHLAVFVVDVSGHGVASSLLSVTIARLMTPQASSSSLLVQQVEDSDQLRIVPPAEVAYELNRRFPMEEQGGLYFTMAYGVLNLQTLAFRYVSAGHDPLVRVNDEGQIAVLPAEGLAIGFMDDVEFDEESIQLAPGDRLFVYSDGIPEAMDAELNEFGEKRMLFVMSKSRPRSLSESVALLLAHVKKWCIEKGPKDDVSLLALEVLVPSEEAGAPATR